MLIETLTAHILRISNKLVFLERRTIFQFENVKLYPSEIHLIAVINTGTEGNATELAAQLGVTKGAVSQTLTRLEKKGVLIKTKDPYHKNELTISLTEQGQQALTAYQKWQANLQAHYGQYIATLSVPHQEVIHRFLTHVEQVLDSLSQAKT